MPANLSPEYVRLEGLLREAKTPEEKLPILQEMLRVIPKHKGTEKLQADLKHRISKLEDASAQRDRAKGRTDPFHVPREGAGQAVLAGAPNSGKSAILDALSHATPAVADFPFTTAHPQPGMVAFEDVQIQMVDAPPLVRDHLVPGIINLYRNADLILLVVDLTVEDPVAQATEIREILSEHLITLVPDDEAGIDPGQVARVRKRTLVLGNKCDEPGAAEPGKVLAQALRPLEVIPFSSLQEEAIAALPARLFRGLHKIRVYTKKPGYPFEKTAPYVFASGTTVVAAAATIHKDLAEQMKEAKIWGSAKHDGVAVPRDHVLEDGDIVELHV